MRSFLFFSFQLSFLLFLVSCQKVKNGIDNVGDNYLGEIVLRVDDSAGVCYQAGLSTINFKSCMTDILEGSATGNVTIGANVNLSSISKLTYPYMGCQLVDTAQGQYPLTNQITVDRLHHFLVRDILSTLDGNSNIFLIALSDTSQFLCSGGGTIELTSFPGYGKQVTGKFNNLEARYVTQSGIDSITHIYNRAYRDSIQYDIDLLNDQERVDQLLVSLFPKVVFTGLFSSRRLLVNKILDKLYD